MPEKIEYMRKIRLSLETDNNPDRESAETVKNTMEFVYGLGSSGLTPFEFALAGKMPGDEIHLRLHRHQIPSYFGHIRIPALQASREPDPIVLKARVLQVQPASSREVVRTLAEIANCGDSCCGQH